MGLSVSELFKVLSNSMNLKILSIIGRLGGSNTRELAKLLGTSESDISRRVSKLRDLGLIKCRWERVGGKNVKLCRLAARTLTLDLINGELVLNPLGGGSIDDLIVRYVGGRVPEVKTFIGRESELRKLRSPQYRVVIVTGIHGIGKTYLIANYLRKYAEAPTYWLSITGNDHVEEVIKKLALFFSSLNRDELSRYLSLGGRDLSVITEILSESISLLKANIVVDDYHKISDYRLKELIISLAKKLSGGKLIVISRRLPTELITELSSYLHLRLRGLNLKETAELLDASELKLSNDVKALVYASTRGHPLLLRMFVDIAYRLGVNEALRAISEGNLYKSLWVRINSSLGPKERELLIVLSCVEEPVTHTVLRTVLHERHVMKYLYTLVDHGLVEDFGGRYGINDLVRAVVSGMGVRKSCRGVYKELAQELIESTDINDLIRGLKYCLKTSDEDLCVRGLKNRVWRIRYRVLESLVPYYEVLNRLGDIIRSSEGIAYLSMELGVVLYNMGRLGESLHNFLKAYRIFRAISDRVMENFVESLLIVAYLELGNVGEALRIADESLRRFKEIENSIEDPSVVGELGFTLYANLARLYSEVGNIRKCYESVLRELHYARLMNDSFYTSLANFHIAVVENLMGMREEVLEPLWRSFYGFMEAGLKSFAYTAAIVLAKVLYELGRVEESLRLINDSIRCFRELRYLDKICDPLALKLLISIESGNSGRVREILSEWGGKCGSGRGGTLYSAALIAANATLNNCSEAHRILRSVGSEVLRKSVGNYIYSKVIEILKRKCSMSSE